MRRLLLAVIALLAGPLAVAGPAYRCTAPGGAVSFQDQPCANARDEQAIELAGYPPVNAAERDRLLQRESALDARMLKRAEMDSAERIAREARWAKEAEYQAERERAKVAEQGYYYPVYAQPNYRARPTPHRSGTSALLNR
jgi:hypothetical protein